MWRCSCCASHECSEALIDTCLFSYRATSVVQTPLYGPISAANARANLHARRHKESNRRNLEFREGLFSITSGCA
jgi:hypothetical protein